MKTHTFYNRFRYILPEDKAEAERFFDDFCKGIGTISRDKLIMLTHLALQHGTKKQQWFGCPSRKV